MQPTLGEQRTPDLPRCARLRSLRVPSGIQQPSRRLLRENLAPSAVVERYDERLREPRQPSSLETPTAIPQAGDQFRQSVRAEGCVPKTSTRSWIRTRRTRRDTFRVAPRLHDRHMGLSLRLLMIDGADRIYRLDTGRLERMRANPKMHPLPQFAGQRVRGAEAAVELVHRKPTRLIRMTFDILTFEGTGCFDMEASIATNLVALQAGYRVLGNCR
jgi:hypothetical protein